MGQLSHLGNNARHAVLAACLAATGAVVSTAWAAEEVPKQHRTIEQVVVTAEKRESTVQDTSISISAFDGDFLQNFGIRNQEDLANFIPSTTIQPYDMAVRGIGRTFRALGGDPGISTYLNGVYSEDFGIASTEGGLFDIERIEVLRGPQGTLYGRNAVGGAVNFISKKPTSEFEAEIKTNIGTDGLLEAYGVVSGPIIDGLLNARVNGIKRKRDGYYEDLSGGPDVGNYGDENYTLYLEFTPTENLSFLARGNERSYRRRMGAAGQTAGIIVINENDMESRNTTAEVFGYRSILSTSQDPLAASFDISQGAAALAATGNANLNTGMSAGHNFLLTSTADASILPGTVAFTDLFRFTNPKTGETVIAQRVRPGVDPSPDDEPNRAFNGGPNGAFAIGPAQGENLDGDDLVTATNGLNDEFFDHQASSFEAAWDVNESILVKYIFGYTDYFYDRTTDRDLTANPNADETFYVSQENENFQHEFQFFVDFGERATLTSGLFFYEARITQRGDYYSANGEARYAQPADYGAGGLTGFVLDAALGNARPDLFSARDAAQADPAVFAASLNANPNAVAGIWTGDNPSVGCSNVPAGPTTCGSFVEYQTNNDTEAFAWYNQAEFFITDAFSLTLGLRYAEDDRKGEELVFLYTESNPETANLAGVFAGTIAPGLDEVLALSALDASLFGAGAAGTSLLAPNVLPVTPTGTLQQYNQSVLAFDPNATVRYAGVPFGVSFYRPVKKKFDQWTWRVNLDWEPNPTTLIYGGITTGYRAGGFNLANLSNDALYPEERITAYELGWKDTLLDGTLQVNASVYYYDYENIHLSIEGNSTALGASVNNVRAAPEAEVTGAELELFWLATDRLSLGGNLSVTDAKYTKDITGNLDVDGDGTIDPNTGDILGASLVQEEFDPSRPGSIFQAPTDRTVSIKNNNLQLVPELKYTLFGIYNFPLDNGGTIELRSNVSYTDSVYFTAENNSQDEADDYYRWDARATWTNAEQDIIVSAFVNNILDEIGIRQISRLGENQNYLRAATITDPRLFGLEVTMKFGAAY